MPYPDYSSREEVAEWALRYIEAQPTPDFHIGPDNDHQLQRWWVVPRNRFQNVYLHRFLRSDDDRALHDHPFDNTRLDPQRRVPGTHAGGRGHAARGRRRQSNSYSAAPRRAGYRAGDHAVLHGADRPGVGILVSSRMEALEGVREHRGWWQLDRTGMHIVNIICILRSICPHRWVRQKDRLESYGMGLEWMAVYRCSWCGDEGAGVRMGNRCVDFRNYGRV